MNMNFEEQNSCESTSYFIRAFVAKNKELCQEIFSKSASSSH